MLDAGMLAYTLHALMNVVPALIGLVACGIFLYRHRCIESILLTIGASTLTLHSLLELAIRVLLFVPNFLPDYYEICSYIRLVLSIVGELILGVGLLLTVINRIRLPGESPAAVTKT